MEKKYLIFCDVDGTIIDSKTSTIPSSTIDAINKLKENGHKVFLCSGRSYPDITDNLKDLNLNGMVLACGAHVLSNETTINLSAISYNTIKEITKLLYDNQVGFALEGINKVYLYAEAYEFFYTILKERDINHDGEAALKLHHMDKFENIIDNDYNSCLKLAIYSSRKDIKHILDQLPENIKYHFDSQFYNYYFGEITQIGINKAYGIKKTLAYYGSEYYTIGIGDSNNDIDMLECCDISIAMGNSCDKLKEVSDYITNDVDRDGFYNAFKHLKLI